MKTTEFMDWLQEYSVNTILLTFMSIGLIAVVVALTIVYFVTRD